MGPTGESVLEDVRTLTLSDGFYHGLFWFSTPALLPSSSLPFSSALPLPSFLFLPLPTLSFLPSSSAPAIFLSSSPSSSVIFPPSGHSALHCPPPKKTSETSNTMRQEMNVSSFKVLRLYLVWKWIWRKWHLSDSTPLIMNTDDCAIHLGSSHLKYLLHKFASVK